MYRSSSRFVAHVCMIACALSPPAIGQVPEGYEVVRLTNDAGIHSRPEINNRSEVVWSSSFPPFDSDVFIFSNGRIRRIHSPGTYDIRPVINNIGSIAWMQGDDWTPPFGVMLHRTSTNETIAVSSTTEDSIAINDHDDLVWPVDISGDSRHAELYRFDHTTESVKPITSNGLSNQEPRMNNDGTVVWTRLDFSTSPDWTSTIMLVFDGVISELTDGTEQPWGPDINDAGVVVWGSNNVGVKIWIEGTTIPFTNPGTRPRINVHGDIAFQQWNFQTKNLDPVLYLNGTNYDLPEQLPLSSRPSINDRGEVAWVSFDDFGDSALFLLRRVAANGDFNHDCRIDLFDFGVMQRCFSGAGAGPVNGFLADCTRGDFDDDGDVDLEDFLAFQNALAPGASTAPGCDR